jgi:hypothetical protein
MGPGPNYFLSGSKTSPSVNAQNQLVMPIATGTLKRKTVWSSSEVIRSVSTGYGTYRFNVESQGGWWWWGWGSGSELGAVSTLATPLPQTRRC